MGPDRRRRAATAARGRRRPHARSLHRGLRDADGGAVLNPIEVEVDLPHPAELVFGYLVDPRNRPEWQSSLLSVTVVDRGEPRVGMEWRDNTVTGVIRPRMRITELEPFEVFAEAGRFGGVSADLRLRFTETPGGCRIHATGQLTGSGPLSSFAARTAARLTPMALRSDLRRAGEILSRGRLAR